MKWMGVNELRESYLSFFESKGHLRHKSYPLVPINDKSLLLINAGMAPLKKYFTGESEPPRHRMTTCQKCIRTPDIDRVGLTARHGTFFEMLGNFSFGDYFKEEALPWAWEYITEVLEMPKDRLWATIYKDDEEAYDIWTKKIGLPAERVVRLGKEDNFWEHGSGPCGPCSEIYFDRGPEFGCGSPDCKPGCDCDRYMEFWNNVFTQFDNDGNGNYTRLAKPNIDTGMGLERLACIMQGVNNLFEVDTVRNIMLAICEKAGVRYGADEKSDISLRVITDHIRSTTFLICDGVVPSNEGRGYVLRRLMRRAARHGRMLGIQGTFLADIVDVVAKENYSEYPELTEKADYIKKIVKIEEERFAATIDSGLSILSGITEKAKKEGQSILSGDEVFKLYDTFGFPVDLTREIAAEAGLSIDEAAFVRLMEQQKQRAREARANISGWSEASKTLLSGFPKTRFTGYTEDESEATVLGIVEDDLSVEAITEGDFTLITDCTPFYGEGGGQVGDTGVISTEACTVTVTDTKKADGVYFHLCHMENGELSVGDKVVLKVDGVRRNAIRRNHSACHLLQAALRQVLGAHVEQAGSYVDENRVRFDFAHYAPLSEEELDKVETLVNRHILAAESVNTVETDVEEAKKAGAMALFGEKYGKVVRMVKMGDFSTELCGGTHVSNTGNVGLFKIISETSVAAGTRRIEGTTGFGVLQLMADKDRLIADTAKELKAPNPHDIAKKAAQVETELKSEKSRVEALESRIASEKLSSLLEEKKEFKGLSLLLSKTENMTVEAVRAFCDNLREKDPSCVVLLGLVNEGKLNLICSVGKNAQQKGVNAGTLVKTAAQVCGGGGGGRPDSAMAGGKFPEKLPQAFQAVLELLEKLPE
ncbi:MAG TPA: alanine--tRNA ligase [Clostridiales bacterium]|nr:alanine--tRNA ligase [Clostridiales bacterium]